MFRSSGSKKPKEDDSPFSFIELNDDVNLEEIISSDFTCAINYSYLDAEFYKIYFKLPEEHQLHFFDSYVYRIGKSFILSGERPPTISEETFMKTQYFKHAMEREFVYANIRLAEYMGAIDENRQTNLLQTLEMSNGTIEYLSKYQWFFEKERVLNTMMSDEDEVIIVRDLDVMRKLYLYLEEKTDHPFVQSFTDFEIYGFLSFPNWMELIIFAILITRGVLIWYAVGNGQHGIDKYLFWNKQLSILFGFWLTPAEIKAIEGRWIEYKYSEANEKRFYYFVERDFQTYVRVFARIKG
jgi:hypothetical protein